MKKFLFFSLFLASLVACKDNSTVSSFSADKAGKHAAAAPFDTLSAIVSQVRRQSRLHTTEFQIHKVVLYEDKAKLGGKWLNLDIPGHRKAAVPLDIRLRGHIDFNGFSASRVKRVDSLVIVTLPDPRISVTAVKIDRKNTRQYISIGRSNFSDEEITRLARRGEDSVMLHISRFGIIEASRENATRLLVPLLCRMGFKESNIIVRFRKDFDADEIRRFVTPLKAQ